MDVEDETNSLTTYSESRDSTGQQSERKKKKNCRGNRQLQRYRRKLRKQGKVLEGIASSNAPSIDQSVSAMPEDSVGSNISEKSLFLIRSLSLRAR